MKPSLKCIIGLSLILGLSGCDKNSSPETTVGEKIDKVTETTGEKIDQATEKASQEMSEASKKTEEVFDDTSITTKAKAAIIAEPTLKSLQINVTTTNGVVSLDGAVDSQQNITRAQEIVNALAGVKEVKNNLVVKSTQ